MSLTDLQNLKAKRNRIIGMKKIDLLDIRPNTLNSFPQDDIEELKENIFAEGLQKPSLRGRRGGNVYQGKSDRVYLLF